ncbi:Protein of unknown function [Caldanaerovirga acetigignens]|uniref:DUF1638 domain-containing protein n=1 Tax=Caldanaerovirga acetigignens TaxID=447595 RepID=A0A1M7K7R2_9FIRM|nr:DUF1638 domain-containing protein [Caldanaerovirga acetigignens]SHM61244.1 Protein of unknown function [Caldanaerovirga acetigignens]
MKNTIIACRMIQDELQHVMDEINSLDHVIWVDSEYHSEPERLKSKLQEIIDNLEGTDNIILVYGYCGNALIGLKATTANLIFPRVNDCISMLLKSERLNDAYYLTRRWIESPASIIQEYKIALERYGEERAKKLFRLMLKNYTKLMLLETGTYDTEKYLKEIQEFAEKVGLKVDSQEGDLHFLKKILIGPYDENDFVIIKKGGKVDLSHIVRGNEKKAVNY